MEIKIDRTQWYRKLPLKYDVPLESYTLKNKKLMEFVLKFKTLPVIPS